MMKRMHIHVGVACLEQGIAFYNALFGVQPNKIKPDYAKWVLEDPRVNFAISTRSITTGIDHLGIQVDDETELQGLYERLMQAELSVYREGNTHCCYAYSNKTWVQDPVGVSWEAFHTMDDYQLYFSKEPNTQANNCSPLCLTSKKRN